MSVFDPAGFDEDYGLQIMKTPFMSANARLAILRRLLNQRTSGLQQNFGICSLLETWPRDESLEVALDYVEGYLGRALRPPHHWWSETDPRQRVCVWPTKPIWLPVSVLWLDDRVRVQNALDRLQANISSGRDSGVLVRQFFIFARRGIHCAQELGWSLEQLRIDVNSSNISSNTNRSVSGISFMDGVVRLYRIKSGPRLLAVLRDPKTGESIDLKETVLKESAGRTLSRGLNKLLSKKQG